MSLQSLLNDTVRLSGPTAVWVLFAHACALVLPLGLIGVVAANFEFIAARTDYPVLFYVTAAVMMTGSAFEIAQNTIDRWHLTPECASAGGKSFCDLLFYWMIIASQALVIIACVGQWWWLTIPIVLLLMAYPWCYPRQRLDIAPLALLGVGSVAAGYYCFAEPLLLLQLLVSPLVGALFNVMLRTGAQFLHGFVTLLAASNALVLTWALHVASSG